MGTKLLLTIVMLFITCVLIILWSISRKNTAPITTNNSTKSLQLQAYERLALLVERISLPQLIAHTNIAGISAKEMQGILTDNLRQEYEYNISQQIYVSQEAWNAVKNLKEQNLLIINQLSNMLPEHSTGLDLNKKILDYTMYDNKNSLHDLASIIINKEAKKVMQE